MKKGSKWSIGVWDNGSPTNKAAWDQLHCYVLFHGRTTILRLSHLFILPSFWSYKPHAVWLLMLLINHFSLVTSQPLDWIIFLGLSCLCRVSGSPNQCILSKRNMYHFQWENLIACAKSLQNFLFPSYHKLWFPNSGSSTSMECNENEQNEGPTKQGSTGSVSEVYHIVISSQWYLVFLQ